MKNIKYLITILISATLGLFVACSTDDKPLDIETPTIENDALYEEALKKVREYKESDHTIVFGWFDNSNKDVISRAQHLMSVPDSVDIISLLYPANLIDLEKKEIAAVQSKKATKVVFSFDFNNAAFLIDNDIEGAEADAREKAQENEQEFVAWTAEQKEAMYTKAMDEVLKEQMTYIAAYGLNGISLRYSNPHIDYISKAELLKIVKRQAQLVQHLKPILDNPDLLFIIEDSPKSILNQTEVDKLAAEDDNFKGLVVQDLVTRSNYVIFRTYMATNVTTIESDILRQLPANFDKSKIIISAAPKYTDEDGIAMGEIKDRQGLNQTAMIELSYWNGADYSKAGLAIYNINKDYYNAGLTYISTRAAIEIMNPSPKN